MKLLPIAQRCFQVSLFSRFILMSRDWGECAASLGNNQKEKFVVQYVMLTNVPLSLRWMFCHLEVVYSLLVRFFVFSTASIKMSHQFKVNHFICSQNTQINTSWLCRFHFLKSRFLFFTSSVHFLALPSLKELIVFDQGQNNGGLPVVLAQSGLTTLDPGRFIQRQSHWLCNLNHPVRTEHFCWLTSCNKPLTDETSWNVIKT